MPRPGDLSICQSCGTVLVFDQKLRLRAITPAQLEQLPKRTQVELLEAQDAWRARQPRSESKVTVP